MVVLLLALLSACTEPPAPAATSVSSRSAPESTPGDPLPPETDFTAEDGVVGSVTTSAAGHRRAWSQRVQGSLSTELVAEEAGDEHIVVSEGNPDRPALSPDGEWLAYVSAESGWASVYVIPFDGGEPLQLTNRGLRAHKGDGMPPGWVAPPWNDSLAFDGDRVVWESPEGKHDVVWR